MFWNQGQEAVDCPDPDVCVAGVSVVDDQRAESVMGAEVKGGVGVVRPGFDVSTDGAVVISDDR